MKTLEDVARFISERDYLRQHHWQLFDLSAARAMTEEMHRQYSAAGEWNMSTPMPAEHCVFWDGVSAVFAIQEHGEISCLLGAEFLYAESMGEVRGKSEEFLRYIRDEAGYKAALVAKFGQAKIDGMIADAESRTAQGDPEPQYERVRAEGQPDGPIGKCIAVWSEFIGFPIARSEKKKIARPIRRRLQRMGVALEVRTVSLSPANQKAVEQPHSPGARKALHFCRGHWRRSSSPNAKPTPKGGLGVWIAGHWRGDPDRGVVLHNYVASLNDVDARSRLIA